jgi:uncharacterized membrane protein YeaQ/YmgE (transglycosylase-associated protein family)
VRWSRRRDRVDCPVRETRFVLWLVLEIVLTGLVVGALGRLVVPGPNPMGIGTTILVGLAGSLLGGLLGRLVFGLHNGDSFGLALLLAVGCTAMIVLAMGRRDHSHRAT